MAPSIREPGDLPQRRESSGGVRRRDANAPPLPLRPAGLPASERARQGGQVGQGANNVIRLVFPSRQFSNP